MMGFWKALALVVVIFLFAFLVFIALVFLGFMMGPIS